MTAYVNGYTGWNEIIFLSRDADGKLEETKRPLEYISFVRKQDLNRAAKIIKRERDRGHLLSCREDGEYVRLEWISYDRRLDAHTEHGPFEMEQIPTYEGDVSPVRRYISDHGIEIAKPRRVYLDIETDSRVTFPRAVRGDAMVLCWCLVDESGKVETGTLTSKLDETRILQRFWDTLKDYDQVVAWNSPFGGDCFDFEVMRERSKRLGIKVNHRRWLWVDQCAAFKRYSTGTTDSGEEKTSYKLGAVSMRLLGEGKHDFDGSKTYEAWAAGSSERQRMVDYCIQDTVLLGKIEAKTGHLALLQSICEVSNCFPDGKGMLPTHQVDGMMLRLGSQRGVRFKTNVYKEDVKKVKFDGGFVMPPACVGITENVYVADFSSLYPSIMMTWNISPETKGIGKTQCTAPTTGVKFSTDRVGILPEILGSLLEQRAKLKGVPGKKVQENAVKTVANAAYGVASSPYSRYFDVDLAESTTQTGVWLLKQTMAEATKRGLEVIYGDTDSVFLRGHSAMDFRSLVSDFNANVYPGLVKATGCRQVRVNLSVDKSFKRIVFLSAKRYIGVTHEGRTECKGVEYKRSDTAKLARELQKGVIDFFASERWDDLEQYKRFVQESRFYVLTGMMRSIDDIAITKAITKDLDQYKVREKLDGEDSAGSAHVRVAKIMRDRGEDVSPGTRVAYVVTDGSTQPLTAIPVADFEGTFDRFYMWEELVYPPTMRLLQAMFPDQDWEQYLKVRPKKIRKKAEPKQTDLPIAS